MYVYTLCKLANLLRNFLERVKAARREDELQVIWLRARKLESAGFTDAGAGACYYDRFALEARGGGHVCGVWEVEVEVGLVLWPDKSSSYGGDGLDEARGVWAKRHVSPMSQLGCM